jgi:hypothetical protein
MEQGSKLSEQATAKVRFFALVINLCDLNYAS